MNEQSSTVLTETDGTVTRITLNRPDKLNAFSAELVEEAFSAFETAESNGIRLVVFQGAGKGFSGGFDLGGLQDMTDGDLLLRFVRVEQFLQRVYHSRIATLALVHGLCYGAAAELVAACQWRFATAEARFRMPGPRFGIVLGTQRLANLIGEDAARQCVLRDAPFGAPEAHSLGYINGIHETADWPETTKKVLSQVTPLDAETYAKLSARQRTDTCNADLAALIHSVTRGSVKARVHAYLDQMAAERKARA